MIDDYRFTSEDLECFPDNDGKRYEIVDGELYVSKPTHYQHQYACGRLVWLLDAWSRRTNTGVAVIAPGVIFSKYDDVAPDVVWMRRERLLDGLDENGHIRTVPELIAEVLLPSEASQKCDREAKLALYSRVGVLEYWIVDWMKPQLEIYRREQGALKQVATLYYNDQLESPLLPEFTCLVSELFF